MTEPTTERGAWLEEVRADVELGVTTAFGLDDPRAAAEAADRVADVHAPAMLRALAAVEALHVPRVRSTYAACRECSQVYPCATVRAIDEARGRA